MGNVVNNEEILVQKGECAHNCVAKIEKHLGKLINTEIAGNKEEIEEKLLDISDETYYKVWDYFLNTRMDFRKVESSLGKENNWKEDGKFTVVDVHSQNNSIISIALNYKVKNDKLLFTGVLTEELS